MDWVSSLRSERSAWNGFPGINEDLMAGTLSDTAEHTERRVNYWCYTYFTVQPFLGQVISFLWDSVSPSIKQEIWIRWRVLNLLKLWKFKVLCQPIYADRLPFCQKTSNWQRVLPLVELKYISYEESSLGFPRKLGHCIHIGNHNDYEKVPGLKVSTQWGNLTCIQLLTTTQGRVKQRDKLWGMGTGGTILTRRGSIWIGHCGMDRF